MDGKEKMDSLIQTGRKSIVAIGGADWPPVWGRTTASSCTYTAGDWCCKLCRAQKQHTGVTDCACGWLCQFKRLDEAEKCLLWWLRMWLQISRGAVRSDVQRVSWENMLSVWGWGKEEGWEEREREALPKAEMYMWERERAIQGQTALRGGNTYTDSVTPSTQPRSLCERLSRSWRCEERCTWEEQDNSSWEKYMLRTIQQHFRESNRSNV